MQTDDRIKIDGEHPIEEWKNTLLLKSISLENFRCFRKELRVEFDERLTIFISENGGGKSTVLDGIALCLHNYLAKMKVQGYDPVKPSTKDITKKADGPARIKANLIADYAWEYEREKYENGVLVVYPETGEIEKDKVRGMAFLQELEVSSTTGKVYPPKIGSDMWEFEEDALPMINGTTTNYPVLAYYGGDSVKISKEYKELTSLTIEDLVYGDALTPNRFAFSTFDRWYKDLDYRRARKDNEWVTFDIRLKKLEAALYFLLNDNPQEPTYKNLRVTRVGDRDELVIDKNNDKELEIGQLSSGEKSLFAFIAGLAIRLLNANPLPETVEEDKVHVISGQGIVLIDEIDLHLHPRWQKKIVGKLLEIFPGIQFVMTTHSPTILHQIHSKYILLIDNYEIYGVPETLGHENTDEMLKIMGYESELRKTLKIIYQHLRKNEVKQAKELRETIKVEGVFAPLFEIDMWIDKKSNQQANEAN